MLVSGHADGAKAADVHAMNIESIPQGRIPGPDETAGSRSSPAARRASARPLPID